MEQKIQTRGLSGDVITGRAPSRGSQCCVVGLLLRSHDLEAGDTPQRQAALFRVVTITVCLHLNKSSGVLFASSIEGLDEAAASFQRSSLRASEREEWVPGVRWTRLQTALSCPGTLACLTLGHMLRMVQVHRFPEWKAWFASRAGTRFEKPTLHGFWEPGPLGACALGAQHPQDRKGTVVTPESICRWMECSCSTALGLLLKEADAS